MRPNIPLAGVWKRVTVVLAGGLIPAGRQLLPDYGRVARDTSKWLRDKAESALKAIRNGSSSFQSVRSNCHPFEGKQD
jgi:hypothetical protein